MESGTLYDVREISSLKDMLGQSAKLFAGKDAFLIRNQDGSYDGIKYSELLSDVNALGSAFLDMGLKGKFIAVLGENRYEWGVTYLSTVNGTGVIVPLDKELPVSDIENILLRSKAETIVFSGKYSPAVNEILNRNLPVKYFINMDISEDSGPFLSYGKLLQKGRELLNGGYNEFLEAVPDNTAMSVLLFTSGTTGFSKGVMLSHKNICSVITSVCKTVKVNSTDSCLSILPLHHTYECTIGFLAMLYCGCTISFNDNLRQIARNLKEVKPAFLVTVPLLLENMYKKIWDQAGKRPGGKLLLRTAVGLATFLRIVFKIDIRRKLFRTIHENLGRNLRLVVSGAAALDPEISRGFRDMGIMVLQGYGLTECAPLVIGNRDRAFKDGSVGLPLPGVQVRIDAPDEKGIGEILVKGDMVMLGYYEDEPSTQKAIVDGWLHTGDLGCIDRDGFVYITGRSKNVIITKNGKNVYPEELEASINSSPLVLESLVFGELDKKTGDTLVYAQILPNLEAIKEKLKVVNISKEELYKVFEELIKGINKEAPLYKRIEKFSVRQSEFIKTTTQKIKRHLEQNKYDYTV